MNDEAVRDTILDILDARHPGWERHMFDRYQLAMVAFEPDAKVRADILDSVRRDVVRKIHRKMTTREGYILADIAKHLP